MAEPPVPRGDGTAAARGRAQGGAGDRGVGAGACCACTARRRPSGFTEAELALVRRLVPHLAEGVRRSTFTPAGGRNRGPDVLSDRPGPGVLDARPRRGHRGDQSGGGVLAGPTSRRRLHGRHPPGRCARCHRRVVTGAGRAPAAAAPAVRLRTRAGEWLSVHVPAIRAGATTAVVIQPASPAQMTSLLLGHAWPHTRAATRRGAGLRGLSTPGRSCVSCASRRTRCRNICAAVFDKLGVGSRRALIAALLTSA